MSEEKSKSAKEISEEYKSRYDALRQNTKDFKGIKFQTEEKKESYKKILDEMRLNLSKSKKFLDELNDLENKHRDKNKELFLTLYSETIKSLKENFLKQNAAITKEVRRHILGSNIRIIIESLKEEKPELIFSLQNLDTNSKTYLDEYIAYTLYIQDSLQPFKREEDNNIILLSDLAAKAYIDFGWLKMIEEILYDPISNTIQLKEKEMKASSDEEDQVIESVEKENTRFQRTQIALKSFMSGKSKVKGDLLSISDPKNFKKNSVLNETVTKNCAIILQTLRSLSVEDTIKSISDFMQSLEKIQETKADPKAKDLYDQYTSAIKSFYISTFGNEGTDKYNQEQLSWVEDNDGRFKKFLEEFHQSLEKLVPPSDSMKK